MSTLEVTNLHTTRGIKFQLYGERHALSFEDIDDAHGVPHGGDQLIARVFDHDAT